MFSQRDNTERFGDADLLRETARLAKLREQSQYVPVEESPLNTSAYDTFNKSGPTDVFRIDTEEAERGIFKQSLVQLMRVIDPTFLVEGASEPSQKRPHRDQSLNRGQEFLGQAALLSGAFSVMTGGACVALIGMGDIPAGAFFGGTAIVAGGVTVGLLKLRSAMVQRLISLRREDNRNSDAEMTARFN